VTADQPGPQSGAQPCGVHVFPNVVDTPLDEDAECRDCGLPYLEWLDGHGDGSR
jgi:hypothetical protein